MLFLNLVFLKCLLILNVFFKIFLNVLKFKYKVIGKFIVFYNEKWLFI